MRDRKAWFAIDGQPGDRTLEQQLQGLDPLRRFVHGQRVLDLGCAEGLLSLWCSIAGATRVLGTDVRPEMIEAAHQQLHRARGQAGFMHHDLEGELPRDIALIGWDIVLALGVLHKLRDPGAALTRIARVARRRIVIRLPGDEGPFAVSRPSGGRVDCTAALAAHGWRLGSTSIGFENEWIGWFER
jgi:2-polyprenyl-3-methyl-5-hydroxy-6-metoxy-1,4-benzoquinol methylase